MLTTNSVFNRVFGYSKETTMRLLILDRFCFSCTELAASLPLLLKRILDSGHYTKFREFRLTGNRLLALELSTKFRLLFHRFFCFLIIIHVSLDFATRA